MLFKPELCEKILSGQKTQTRRLGRDVDRPVFKLIEGVVQVNRNGRRKWQVGRTYAVQPGRGKTAIGRIRLLKIRCEKLNKISPEDCWAEGIARHGGSPFCKEELNAIHDFSYLWDGINKPPNDWDGNPSVWVLEFELVKG